MHPITVYGIETILSASAANSCASCMHPITVYGIETLFLMAYHKGKLHAPYYRLRY